MKKLCKGIPAYIDAKNAFEELSLTIPEGMRNEWIELEQDAKANGGTQLEQLWEVQIQRSAGGYVLLLIWSTGY